MIAPPTASFSRSAWVAENLTSRPAASNSPSSMPTMTGRSKTWLLGAIRMTGLNSVMGVLFWLGGDNLAAPQADLRILAIALEALKQPAPAENLVFYAVRAERMPDGRDVDRDHRLAELLFQRRKDVLGREIGARLHDGVDIVAVELVQHRIDHLLRRGVRDRGGG